MSKRPPALLTYYCKSCGAIVALLAPGALVYDTRLRCPACESVQRIIKALDDDRVNVYTDRTAIPA